MFCRILLFFLGGGNLAEIYKIHFYIMIEYLEVVCYSVVPTYHITGVITEKYMILVFFCLKLYYWMGGGGHKT